MRRRSTPRLADRPATAAASAVRRPFADASTGCFPAVALFTSAPTPPNVRLCPRRRVAYLMLRHVVRRRSSPVRTTMAATVAISATSPTPVHRRLHRLLLWCAHRRHTRTRRSAGRSGRGRARRRFDRVDMPRARRQRISRVHRRPLFAHARRADVFRRADASAVSSAFYRRQSAGRGVMAGEDRLFEGHSTPQRRQT